MTSKSIVKANENAPLWRGYLILWGDPIPELPGLQFRFTDRTIFNIPEFQGSDVPGVGLVWNFQKDETGMFLVVRNEELDLTGYEFRYIVKADEIEPEYRYDPATGESVFRLKKYPITGLKVVNHHASTPSVVTQASSKRRKRPGGSA